MDATKGVPLKFGRIRVGERKPFRAGLPGFTVARHVWTADKRAGLDLPEDFSLELDCIEGPDGRRRFTPVDTETFLLKASLGGFAIRFRRVAMGPEERSGYHLRRLVSRLLPGFQEHLDRRFRQVSELYLVQDEKPLGEGGHILPPTLGAKAAGGTSWTPRELLRQGEAEAAGRKCDTETLIRLGLLRGARIDPYDPASLSPEEALGLVRYAVIGLPRQGESLSPEKQGVFEDRLYASLKKKGNLTTDAFRTWFLESMDNVIHAIAKRKGGSLSLTRQEARRGMLDLAFGSHLSVAEGVHVVMTDFAATLKTHLTSGERPLFEGLFARQPHFGNLVFLQLRARFAWLREAAVDYLDDPTDPARVGIVLRLLEYYGDMTGKRREADASARRRNRGKAAKGGPRKGDSGSKPDTSRVDGLKELIVEASGFSCRCGNTLGWGFDTTGEITSAGPIDVVVLCEHCDASVKVTLSKKRLRDYRTRHAR